ncbi:MAG: DNA-directed RNA polymerase subunit alpha [Deltaproteobacteria bacterium]|nr:DNA-directed RNA polymerase subunit alpha [Deltaproteobacteria bacterium]
MYRNWTELIRPERMEVERETLTPFYGKFEAKPLERGYGLTIGNSLRRVLLSSLLGAAITKIRIGNVYHEFSPIPDAIEDVTAVVLNLKSMRFRCASERPVTVTIDKKGDKVITGKDFICPESVKVLTPDQLIVTLGKEAHFKMECVIEQGRGYRPADENKSPDDAIDVIAIDSLFSPVRKVNYTVTHARVGQRTDYDRLLMEIWTDGSIKPEDALGLAAKIVKEQLAVFVNFDEQVEITQKGEGSASSEQKKRRDVNDLLYKSIDEMELSVRSSNCLHVAGIKYIGHLVEKTENELLKTKNFGRKSLNEIKELVESLGLNFGTKLENFPSLEDLDQMKKERDEGKKA